mgnify:CR=1 FL=1
MFSNSLKNSLVGILLLTTLSVKCENLINNGDFTQGLPPTWLISTGIKSNETEKTLPGGSQVTFGLDKENFHSAPVSLCFKSSVQNSITSYNTLPINLISGKKYRFAAWYFLKTDSPKKCSLTGRIAIRFKEANSKNKNHFPTFEITTDKWTRVETDFIAPAGLKDALFTLWFSGEGILNWDDVEVKEIHTH